MVVSICVGSSCHLKGTPELIELLEKLIKEHQLEKDITLTGSFCIGKCNREGVTIKVDDRIHIGINRENFKEFFNEHILTKVERK